MGINNLTVVVAGTFYIYLMFVLVHTPYMNMPPASYHWVELATIKFLFVSAIITGVAAAAVSLVATAFGFLWGFTTHLGDTPIEGV